MSKAKYIQFKTQQVECFKNQDSYIIDCGKCDNRILLCGIFRGLCDVKSKECKTYREIKQRNAINPQEDLINNIDDGVDIEKEKDSE